MEQTILTAFNQYFKMVPACSDELRMEVYKLRFQVYCNETCFEDPLQHPGEIECDEYDTNSIHYLIYHRKSNAYAATTRLILPNTRDIKKLFPIEVNTTIDNLELLKAIPRNKLAEVSRFCVSKESLFPIEVNTTIDKPELLKVIPRNKLAEVSRFCVSKGFKRRKYDKANSLTGISEDFVEKIAVEEKRTFPHITIALIACLIRASEENGIEYWLAVMEPALLRFLSTLGIYFKRIGPMTEYHGKRQPCIIKVSDLLSGVLQKKPPLWDMLTNNGQYGGALNTTSEKHFLSRFSIPGQPWLKFY